MRNVAARKNRSTIYRVISVVCILLGLMKGISSYLHRDAMTSYTFLSAMETAAMWLVFAVVWVALSRIWSEMAEEAAGKE